MSTKTEIEGLINGHPVDGKLYRSGNVTMVGIQSLVKLGVVHVISLQNRKQDSPAQILFEQGQVEAAGMKWSNHPMDSSGWFSYDDIVKVPAILDAIEKTEGRVLIHCAEGKDRSSIVSACYRITHGMSVKDAIAEGERYGWHFYNCAMRRAVKDFARKYLAKGK